MRILVQSINYAPELTGIGKYTTEMCAWLAARGHEVTVITAPPYYPEWRIHDGYRSGHYSRERMEGVHVYRCPIWVPAKPGGVKRILHLASFALSSLPLVIGAAMWRPRIVITIEPPLFCAPGAWLTARLCGAQAWLHVQDLEIDAAFELGLLPSALKRFVGGVERWLLRRFDGVSTICLAMRDRLLSKGLAPERCALFENWVDCSAIFPLPRSSEYRCNLEIPADAFIALYSGNMGTKQGLEIVVEAARRLAATPDVCFVMCGDGVARDRLQALARGLPNLRWLPLQPANRLNELLNLANVHLLPQLASASDLVLPSKLTGMFASGKPVLATANSGTTLARVVSEAGMVVPPDDVDAMVTALMELKGDAARCAGMGARARRYAEVNFAKDAVLRHFESTLKVKAGCAT